jgi:hypothetical protein
VADIGTVGVFSGSGNSYTLDLGTVTQASARTQAVVELENVATALADALTGAVAFSGTTSAFINSGVGPLGSIAAGGSSTALDISLSTANTGTFTETATYTVSSTDAGGATVLTPVTIAVTGTVAAPAGTVYTLTSGVDTVNGNAGINTVIASGGALSAGDQIDGGSGGDNTLVLQGAGIFNLALPATLTDIETIEAQEGQSSSVVNGVAYASSAQTVTLRAGENNVTVNVAAANINANNPSQPTITITGAANNDVINLATGNDVVTMGAGESAYGGGGNDTFLVSASTISNVVINGGTGDSTLWFTGGGVVSLGSDPNITNISTLYLASATTAYTVSAGGASGLTVQDASKTTTDQLTAQGSDQTLTGGGAGKLTMTGAIDTTFKDTAALLSGDTIRNWSAGDIVDVTGLAYAASGGGQTTLSFGTSGGNTTVAVLAGGVQKTSFTLTGSYNPGNFTIGSDGGTGTAIGYHVTAA